MVKKSLISKRRKKDSLSLKLSLKKEAKTRSLKSDNKTKRNPKVKARKILTKDKKGNTNKNIFINQLIRNNFHITNTCIQTNTNRMTYYHWLRTDEKFAKKMDDLRELDVDNFEDALRVLVEERNPQAVIFGLKTRGKNRGYIERTEVEHSGSQRIEFNIIQPKGIEHKEEKQIKTEKQER